MLRKALLVATLLGLGAPVACIPPRPQGSTQAAEAPPVPEDGISVLEARLRAAPSVRVRFSIVSKGVVPSSFEGSLVMQPRNRMKLDAQGTLEQKPARPALFSDGQRMQGGSLEKSFASEAPAGLGDAVALGLTRMGLLHNLVVLANGAPPDGADGSIQSFAAATDVRRGRNEGVNGVDAERYDFKVIVRGKPMGEATLWLDARTHNPIKRHQVVHFPDGDLTVDETYQEFVIGGPIDPRAFDPGSVPMEI